MAGCSSLDGLASVGVASSSREQRAVKPRLKALSPSSSPSVTQLGDIWNLRETRDETRERNSLIQTEEKRREEKRREEKRREEKRREEKRREEKRREEKRREEKRREEKRREEKRREEKHESLELDRLFLAAALERRQIVGKNSIGVCRYGSRIECCYGWKKNNKGHCEAQCEPGCKHGECVGPNKCKCFPGYTGKTCSQDLNECGLKPRPCEHRCMNTFGSYMCYCLNGYMLLADGSCANSRTCSLAHCQYGCEEVDSEVRCLCPSPGLQLGDDGKTCQDVNECASNTHTCSHHAECINTLGSFKCKCKQGFRGSGFHCSAIPDFPSKTRMLGRFENSVEGLTPTKAAHHHLQPFDYDGEVYIGPPEETPSFPEEEEEEEEETGNQLEPDGRGDVFSPEDFVAIYGSDAEPKEIQAAPLKERFLTDCDFDRGACEWVQDNEDDLDWSIKYHENGREYYLTVDPPVVNQRRPQQAKLKLLLDDQIRQSSFCLSFDYRMMGERPGTLRVKLDTHSQSSSTVWERKQRPEQSQSWQHQEISISWREENPEAIIFEGERGRSGAGEIAVDHVLLFSGSCSEEKSVVILLGDGGVGKSSLMNRYVTNKFEPDLFHTIGVEFLNKDLQVDGRTVTLQIWDTAGQERFRSLRTPFYRGSDCCLLTFSVDDSQSFQNLANWKKEFVYYADVQDPEHFPFVVLGNKVDVCERTVKKEEAQEWCQESGGVPYYETSAKDASNVCEAFEEAVRRVLSLEETQQPLVPTESIRLHSKPARSRALYWFAIQSEDMSSGDEGRDKPLVELVDSFEEHAVIDPHVLIHQIQSSVSDELIQEAEIPSQTPGYHDDPPPQNRSSLTSREAYFQLQKGEIIMSAGKDDGLSSDEMRQKLYQTFKSRGLLDTLKELQQPGLQPDSTQSPSSRVKHPSVFVTMCNSVVADHLRCYGYEYTLSVFYPECGLTKDKQESTMQKGKTGFLLRLLTELTDPHVYRESCDSSTQTSSISAHKKSLVEKMQLIDEEYAELRQRGDRWGSVETKLSEYRREIQEQAQLELNAKLQHFMEVEVEKVKREEREKTKKEMLELRRELERNHQLKSEALISREKNAIERLQKQQEVPLSSPVAAIHYGSSSFLTEDMYLLQIEEKEIYSQRQAVLKEIESVRSRENELKLRTEAFTKNCALQEEKQKVMEDLLRRRETAVKSSEDSFEQRLKSELLKFQLDLKEDYTRRTEKLTEDERKINEETVRLQKEVAVIEAKGDEHAKLLAETKRLTMELESLRSQLSLLNQQKELLQEELKLTSDYPELKKQTLEMNTQIRVLKHQLEDNREQIQHLQQGEAHRVLLENYVMVHHRSSAMAFFPLELLLPSKEHLQLQAELRRIESERKHEREEFETQRNILHSQLQQEVQQTALMKAQLMECEERNARMKTHSAELKLQLQQTEQALENEILKSSVLSLLPEQRNPPDLHPTPPLINPRAAVSDSGPSLRGPNGAVLLPVTPGGHSELVNGALSRIRDLEEEAERLEEAYRRHQRKNFHREIAQIESGIDHALPRRSFNFIRGAASQHRALTSAGGRVGNERYQDLSRSPPREKSPGRMLSPPARRLSSTPRSASKSKHREGEAPEKQNSSEDHRRLCLDPDPEFSERLVSPIPDSAMISSISLPSSPTMKSTTRHSRSPPKLEEIIISGSSQESSPQPEKITLHDLTHAEQNVKAAAADEVQLKEEEELEEKSRSEEEKDRVQLELEDQYECAASEQQVDAERHVTESASAIGQEADDVDPLQKYMQMLEEDKQQQQSPKKEASESPSHMNVLSERNEHSVGEISHEEVDDDFWCL
ncbi:hypothetical protein DNTS_004640 [Danionella cerebrum]|uniref:small monomeric GTPase n=1 Tax=Danionella cerebrum TaxID=2873325 RepID=A0A553RD20_9TELE|nr:hypothetical protein DNTS_004640 [Danionella translucida]